MKHLIRSNTISISHYLFQEDYVYSIVRPCCAIRHQLPFVLGPVQRDVTPTFLFQ